VGSAKVMSLFLRVFCISGLYAGPSLQGLFCHFLYGRMLQNIMTITNEGDLAPRHDKDPIYIETLQCFVTFGHFVIVVLSDHRDVLVGQLIRRTSRGSNVVVCLYLPLYHEEMRQHMNNITILPRPICHMLCVNVTELVNVSKVAEVSMEAITGLAFVFLSSHVTEYVYHIHGMKHAYVLRYIFSPSSMSLFELNSTNFFSFPDLHQDHQRRWCDCVGRSIFSTIEDLHQELWHVLCRYGQSQGSYPKATIKLHITSHFSQYLIQHMVEDGLTSQLVSIMEKHRRINSTLTYRSVSFSESYFFFELDTAEKLAVFARLIGEMSVAGV